MDATRNAILFRTAQEIDAAQMSGRTAVVIDVLRATTTIATAIAAGARRVIPCRSPQEALAIRADLMGEPVVLGGERKGLKIPGFDLDNSPLAYTAEAVGDKTVVITTTNGTEAMVRSERARALVCASFVNAAAVCDWLAGQIGPLAFVCAGTEGQPTREDELCAGLLICRLETRGCKLTLSGAAAAAADAWRGVSSLAEALRECDHARYLTGIGFGADVEYAARLDSLAAVPLRSGGGLIRAR